MIIYPSKSVFKTKKVTLTHDTLLAITEASPAILVPAKAGKILIPINIIYDSQLVVPYTTDSDWLLFWGLAALGFNIGNVNSAFSANHFGKLASPAIPDDRSGLTNQPIVLSPATGGSPLADGDVSNVITFEVGYYEYTIPKPSIPAVGIFSDGLGGWEMRDGNTAVPDGFIVSSDAGATFDIDTEATIGLTPSITAGDPEVTNP